LQSILIKDEICENWVRFVANKIYCLISPTHRHAKQKKGTNREKMYDEKSPFILIKIYMTLFLAAFSSLSLGKDEQMRSGKESFAFFGFWRASNMKKLFVFGCAISRM
jgi:hypothetical protein